MSIYRARQQLAKWQERLAYVSRELARLPSAKAMAAERVAHWETRLAALEEQDEPEEPEVMQSALTRTDDRWLSRYESNWRKR